MEAINFAISFEKDTIIFFYGFLDFVKEKTRDIVMRLVEEEKSHIKQLYEIKSKME